MTFASFIEFFRFFAVESYIREISKRKVIIIQVQVEINI